MEKKTHREKTDYFIAEKRQKAESGTKKQNYIPKKGLLKLSC